MHTDVRESEQNEAEYTTPRWVQVWFLRKSRRLWKSKYQALKVERKRLQNRVNDTTKSREKWRDDAKELARRVLSLPLTTELDQDQVLYVADAVREFYR